MSCQVGPGARPPVVRTLRGFKAFTRLGAQRPGGCLPAASISHVRNGGKNTRGESFSPLDSPLWFGMSFGVSLFFVSWPAALCPTWERARPPAGRAGRRGLVDRGTGSGKIQQKNILPKESLQIRARTWGCDKKQRPLRCGSIPKEGASPSERFDSRGCRGEPPATLCVRAFSRESLDPRPG